MKKSFLSVLLFVSVSTSFAQKELNGNINIPRLQSVTVEQLDERAIDFSTIKDYADGKIVTAYCRITVKCNFPWKLLGEINSAGILGDASSTGLISIQQQGSNSYIPLSIHPTVIIKSSNNNITNEYTFNLKIDPKLKITKDVLMMNLSFALAPL
jgi:hypothetical protein